MKLLNFPIAMLAFAGTYIMAIWAVQSLLHKDFDAARHFVGELIKDFIGNRDCFRLECSDFPLKLTKDVEAYLTGENLVRWKKRFSMYSQCMDGRGITPNGLPYYQFKVLLTSENDKLVYQDMVRDLAYESLSLARCSEKRVFIEWEFTREDDFQICRVIYARTAFEQEKFHKMLETCDSLVLKTELDDTSDPDLDSELDKYGGSKNDEH